VQRGKYKKRGERTKAAKAVESKVSLARNSEPSLTGHIHHCRRRTQSWKEKLAIKRFSCLPQPKILTARESAVQGEMKAKERC